MSLKSRAAAVAALALFLGALSPGAQAETPADEASVSAAANWIADQYLATPSRVTGAAGLSDALIALSAAGRRADVVAPMVGALKESAPAYITNPAALAKVIIAADAAGQDARHLLGCERDLVDELGAQVTDQPSSATSFFGPYLVAIAFTRHGLEVPQSVFDALLAAQQGGAFGATFGGRFNADPDYTALGIAAMRLIAQHTSDGARASVAAASAQAAIDWSQQPANQKVDATTGAYYWTTYSPANSTGLLAAALAEAGVDVSSPRTYLRSQQERTTVGAWPSTHNGTTANFMATTQAILAMAGHSYATADSTQVPDQSRCATATVTASTTATTTATVTSTATATNTVDVTRTTTATATATATATSTVDVTRTTTATATATSTATATRPISTLMAPYEVPGFHKINGRDWFTACEPYSATYRCTTSIWSSRVVLRNGAFVTETGFVFNNLTYLPYLSQRDWGSNPLATPGEWTANDGRRWRTECHTALTGRGACRSSIWAQYVDASGAHPVVKSGWVFNNLVRFAS